MRGRALEERLARFEAETGHQIAVLTVPTLKGDSLEDFSIRVAESWKIGPRRLEFDGTSNGRSVLWGCVDSTGPGYRKTRAEDAAQASLIRQQNEVPGNRQSTLALAA